MNFECTAPQIWKTSLIKKDAKTFILNFSFQNQIYTKEIRQTENQKSFNQAFQLFENNWTSWNYQKFHFDSFEEKVDLNQMIDNELYNMHIILKKEV